MSDDLQKQFEKAIREFKNEHFEATQESLIAVAEDFAKTLSSRSPVESGKFARSWKVDKRYPNAKYVHNTAMASNRIPLINLIEYSPRHTPFVKSTFNQSKGRLLRNFQKQMRQKLKK